MEILRCRTRLAVLWIIRSLIPVLLLLLFFFEPGTIENLMEGKFGGRAISGGFLIGFGAVCWIPWIMAWAVMTLKLSINRWANTILGSIGAILFLIAIFSDINKGLTATLITYIFGFILHVLITWYGWKLPGEEASPD